MKIYFLRPSILAVILLFFLIESQVELLANNKRKLLSIRELNLGSYQYKALTDDLPATMLSLSELNQAWILGRTSLWKWNYIDNSLRKIRLPKSRAGKKYPIKHFLAKEEAQFIANDNGLYYLEKKRRKINFYSPPSKVELSISYGLVESGSKIFWLTKNAVWQFDEKNKKLKVFAKHPSLKKNDMPHYDHKANKLWILRSTELLLYSYAHPERGIERKLKIKQPFLQINQIEGDLVLNTQYTTLVLDQNAEIQRTLPVKGLHKLVKVHLTPQQHSYLLHDRYIETHMIKEKISYYAKIETGVVKKVSSFSARQNIFAMILDGQPRLFQAEGKW